MVKKYQLIFTKQAQKDAKKIGKTELKKNVQSLLSILEVNPFKPPLEALVGSLKGAYSRRINIQHRLVYQIIEEKKIVKILRMWTHYGE